MPKSWKDVWAGPGPYMFGGVVGVPIGIWLCSHLPAGRLIAVSGALLVGYAVYWMFKPSTFKLHCPAIDHHVSDLLLGTGCMAASVLFEQSFLAAPRVEPAGGGVGDPHWPSRLQADVGFKFQAGYVLASGDFGSGHPGQHVRPGVQESVLIQIDAAVVATHLVLYPNRRWKNKADLAS